MVAQKQRQKIKMQEYVSNYSNPFHHIYPYKLFYYSLKLIQMATQNGNNSISPIAHCHLLHTHHGHDTLCTASASTSGIIFASSNLTLLNFIYLNHSFTKITIFIYFLFNQISTFSFWYKKFILLIFFLNFFNK